MTTSTLQRNYSKMSIKVKDCHVKHSMKHLNTKLAKGINVFVSCQE